MINLRDNFGEDESGRVEGSARRGAYPSVEVLEKLAQRKYTRIDSIRKAEEVDERWKYLRFVDDICWEAKLGLLGCSGKGRAGGCSSEELSRFKTGYKRCLTSATRKQWAQEMEKQRNKLFSSRGGVAAKQGDDVDYEGADISYEEKFINKRQDGIRAERTDHDILELVDLMGPFVELHDPKQEPPPPCYMEEMVMNSCRLYQWLDADADAARRQMCKDYEGLLSNCLLLKKKL